MAVLNLWFEVQAFNQVQSAISICFFEFEPRRREASVDVDTRLRTSTLSNGLESARGYALVGPHCPYENCE
eukprot:m.142624 g.142624  ORF g.142624 m.142624 type:complete len:71 (+) comp14075_c0_seq2:2269-2481(+)